MEVDLTGFEDALPGFTSGMRRGRKPCGALGNASGAESGGALVGSGKSPLRASGDAKYRNQTFSHQHQQPDSDPCEAQLKITGCRVVPGASSFIRDHGC